MMEQGENDFGQHDVIIPQFHNFEREPGTR